MGRYLRSASKSGYGEKFLNKIQKWNNDRPVSSEQPCKDSTSDTVSLLALCKQIWRTVIPQMEVLRPGWHTYLRKTLVSHFMIPAKVIRSLPEIYAAFAHDYPDWTVHEEQLLLYWIYTYFCGAVYDNQIFAKVKMAVICTFMIHELAVGTWLKNDRHFTFEDMISICYRFSRELEHSDPNLNEMERLMDEEDVFDFRNLLTNIKDKQAAVKVSCLSFMELFSQKLLNYLSDQSPLFRCKHLNLLQ